jgi:hypothetical protein
MARSSIMKTKMMTLRLLIALSTATALPAHTQAASLLGCFARAYVTAHLAQHPDQIVTAVKLKLYPRPSDPRQTWFAIQMQRRGEYSALHNEGFCKQD